MDPPPEMAYPSLKALMESVQTFAATQGYVVTKKRTVEGKKLWIKCDRGGRYDDRYKLDDSTRQRTTASRLIDCPFELYARVYASDKQWHLKVKCSEHNHARSESLSGHPIARRLVDTQKASVRQMFSCGISPRDTLTTLRQDDTNQHLVARTIYNARAAARRDSLNGRTTIEALMDELRDQGYNYDYQCDGANRVTHLFFAHPFSLQLCQLYSTVILMDCTYKTNKFKMPLLHVVGMTAFNTTFSICFVFLKEEKEADYVWALRQVNAIFSAENLPETIVTDRELALMNALRVVFPSSTNLLCVWHINKNVAVKCKSFFANGEDWERFLSMWVKVLVLNTGFK
jgi:hypothetical protein